LLSAAEHSRSQQLIFAFVHRSTTVTAALMDAVGQMHVSGWQLLVPLMLCHVTINAVSCDKITAAMAAAMGSGFEEAAQVGIVICSDSDRVIMRAATQVNA
jgi:hypothetical protein